MKEIVSEPSSSSSPSNKRSRDPEDEVYLDNFHNQKRYLSEIMASSLNGLSVEDPLPENLVVSPARSETMCYFRDDISLQYSPMSEDSDDARYTEIPLNTYTAQPDSRPTSPGSPHRHYRPLSGFSSTIPATSYPSLGCPLTATACAQPRQRGSDSESRFPSSPSDICHSADLRRAALLRSVQMRAHPPSLPSYELSFSPEREPMQNMEAEEQHCSCAKSLLNDCECQNVEGRSSMGMSETEITREKSCRILDMNEKEGDPVQVFGRSELGRTDLMSS